MANPGSGVTDIGTVAGKALIAADPVLGSLVVIFMITTGIAVWRWVKATREIADIQKQAFEALSKRDEATSKVVAEAVRGLEDVRRAMTESGRNYGDLEKQVIKALAVVEAKSRTG